MNVPGIRGSIVTQQAEAHIAAAAFHVDFTLLKIPPPEEYRDIGQSLSARRRIEAAEGDSHVTAVQLGFLFGGIVPRTPHLIRVYGLRSSEVANSPKFNPKGTSQHGLFANEVGADGTAIWSAATSGEAAIAVHLLACMLSRMWDPPAAISIWMQLITERKQALMTSGNPLDIATSKAIDVTREQIASWHTSTQAWRLSADQVNTRRQSQLLLITNNLGLPVSTKNSVTESVIEAWQSAMVTIDNLLAGCAQSVQTGAPLLGLAAWHIYPDMIIYGHGRHGNPTKVTQDDPLVPQSGVLTLGIQDMRRSGLGIYWSLPLAHLRYYGQPVQAKAWLSSNTSRVSISGLMLVAIGSLIRRWCTSVGDIELALTTLVELEKYVDIPVLVKKEGSWLTELALAAERYLGETQDVKSQMLQMIKCGRRRYPLFIDDHSSEPIFGLRSCKTTLGMMVGNASRVSFLRTIAKDFTDDRHLMVIQCRTGDSEKAWDLLTVEQFSRKRKRFDERPMDFDEEAFTGNVRWVNRHHKDKDHTDIPYNTDAVRLVRLDSPIPCLWAPHGHIWERVPRAVYGILLGREDPAGDWGRAKAVAIRSLLAFGDPDIAALYCLEISYWTEISPNFQPKIIRHSDYRRLPNICILPHILRALDECLLSRESLFIHLQQGVFSSSMNTALRALSSVSNVYKQLSDATIDVRVAETPLSQHHWIPESGDVHGEPSFSAFQLSREQMFACIARFESGKFNFEPSAMHGVLAISSGNSIYVSECLLQDPCESQAINSVQRIVGNLGKTGMALLLSPQSPQVRSISEDVRLVNHHPFDGQEEDCFHDTSLHLSYTEWQLPIDVGSRGNRDVEAYYIEAAIGLYERGKWVADLSILDVFHHRFSRILPQCNDKRHSECQASAELRSSLVTIDSWEELLDGPTEVGIVRAKGNWQARLAAAALAVQRGHETRIIPQEVCWRCCFGLPPLTRSVQEKTVYEQDEDIDFGVVERWADDEGSDSETEELVERLSRRAEPKDLESSPGKDNQRHVSNQNVIFIL